MRLRSLFALMVVAGAVTACSILVDTTGLVGNAPSTSDGGETDATTIDADTGTNDGAVDGAMDGGDSATSTVIALDDFAREVGSGFGNADIGGAWTNKPGTKAAAVITTGAARVTLQAGGGYHTILADARALDTDLRTDFTIDKAPSGSGVYIALTTRALSESTSYHATLVLRDNGNTTARLSTAIDFNEDRMLGDRTMAFGSTQGVTFHLRYQATGTKPTTLRFKVWRDSETEPSLWTLEGTDDTAQLQRAGASGLDFYLSGSATVVPLVCSVGRFEVRALTN